ncbi:MAG TPA: MinD/ParA family protein, partial [Fimbriimonadaceae bacterium]|nr:MinD/ParA family protein [Fimbriimonadaceae bacterium]
MKTIAIASGKGGVGKTNIATNLAIALAHDEKKVLVVDADLGLSNVDVLLAISPQSTMKDVVSGDVQAGQAVTATEYDIDVISGGTGAKELVDLDQESLDGLWKQVNKLTEQYDHVVIDTASGIGRSVMTFLKKADRVLVVCTPDPTSMMDAYATTKLLFDENPQADVALLVNMADNVRQGLVVFERYKAIVGQFLNREISLAGVIIRDATVLNCTRSREPFMVVSPGC